MGGSRRGAAAATLFAVAAIAVYMQFRKKKVAPAQRMSQQELSLRLVALGKQRSEDRISRAGAASPTSHPPPLTSGDSSQSSLGAGRKPASGGAGAAGGSVEELEEESDEEPAIRDPAEEALWKRIEAVLAEYSLNVIAKVAARKWVREMGDPAKPELRRLRDWLLAKVNGHDRVKPLSAWQSGCPEILGGLRAQPVWPVDAFECLRPFVEHADEICKELLALRAAQRSGFQPLKIPNWATQTQKVASPDGAGSLSHDAGDWNVFYLQLHEVDFKVNRERCPTTARLLEGLGPRSYQHAFFSALTPGTHILKHHGPSNKKLRVHLPLLGTEGAELRVADQRLTFTPGAPVVFDDSFEHEAWHTGDATRIVLVFDLWHPDLSDREVQFLSFLLRSRMRAEKRAEAAARAARAEGGAAAEEAVEAGDNFYRLLEEAKDALPDNTWWV